MSEILVAISLLKKELEKYNFCISKVSKSLNVEESRVLSIVEKQNHKYNSYKKQIEALTIMNNDMRKIIPSLKVFDDDNILLLEKYNKAKTSEKINIFKEIQQYVENKYPSNDPPFSNNDLSYNEQAANQLWMISRTLFLDFYKPKICSEILTGVFDNIENSGIVSVKYKDTIVNRGGNLDRIHYLSKLDRIKSNGDDIELNLMEYLPKEQLNKVEGEVDDYIFKIIQSRKKIFINFGKQFSSIKFGKNVNAQYDYGILINEKLIPIVESFDIIKNKTYNIEEISNIFFKISRKKFINIDFLEIRIKKDIIYIDYE